MCAAQYKPIIREPRSVEAMGGSFPEGLLDSEENLELKGIHKLSDEEQRRSNIIIQQIRCGLLCFVMTVIGIALYVLVGTDWLLP